MAPSPFSIGIRRNFSSGGNVAILLVIFRLLTMQCKKTFPKRFTHCMQKEIAPFYGNSHKKCNSLAAIAISCVHCDKLKNTLSEDFSRSK